MLQKSLKGLLCINTSSFFTLLSKNLYLLVFFLPQNSDNYLGK